MVYKLCGNKQSNKRGDYEANPVVYEIDNPENATFKITDTKITCSSCYFIKRKSHKTFRITKNRI